jgi:hypothetical protein
MSSDRIFRLFGDSAEEIIVKECRWLAEMSQERALTPRLSDDPDGDARFNLLDQLGFLLLHHYGRAEGFPTANQAARRGVELGRELFFGEWRNQFAIFEGPAWNNRDCRERLGWYDTFRGSLCCALLLSDLAAVRELSQYPGPDARQSEVEATRRQHEFYLVLAGVLRGEVTNELQESWKSLKRAPQTRLKQTAQALEFIENGDSDATLLSIKKLCAHYRTHRDDIRAFYAAISLDASILWNLAKLRNLQVDNLTVDEQDVVVTPSSCNLIHS